MKLDELALQYRTDKQSTNHNYTAVYELLFSPFRQDTFNMLEIGIKQGASIKMWRDYFPNANIYAVDIKRKYVNHLGDWDRFVLEQLDQGDEGRLLEYAKQGPWRVIIDDGSHRSSHQKLTFEVLWDCVEPGGYYIIEDTHTSYVSHPKHGWKDCDESLMDRMLKVTDEVCSTPYDSRTNRKYFINKETDGLTQYQKEIESVTFRLGMVIIKKRA